MKHFVFPVIVMFVATAFAQAPKEAAKPAPEAAKAEAKMAAKPAADPAKQAAAGTKKPHKRWSEDARECLEKTSSTEVIKCAEEFY